MGANGSVPPDSVLEAERIARADLVDVCAWRLNRSDCSVVDLFFAVLGHHPAPLKALLVIRHRVGAWFGLAAATSAAVLQPRRAARYQPGDTIGPWPLFFLNDRELVAGRDNRHLDFRLSVLKHRTGTAEQVIFSTVCTAHNAFGRWYLRIIGPFHTRGMLWLLRRAVRAGRL